ncbi:MAG: PH domain-containing protein [Bacteroidetes bacterium]|nr:PH domain-containing protein [Bacteroidota bacterium]
MSEPIFPNPSEPLDLNAQLQSSADEADPTSPPALLPLSPAIKKVWTIKSALAVAVITLGVGVFDLARFFTTSSRTLPIGLPTIGILTVGSVLAYFVPRLRYRVWRYRLGHEELVIQRGLINRIHTVVPLRRIQHLDVSQDIVEREFELGKLIVHTAGTRSSDVVLPGLDVIEANRLRDLMKDYILEDAV